MLVAFYFTILYKLLVECAIYGSFWQTQRILQKYSSAPNPFFGWHSWGTIKVLHSYEKKNSLVKVDIFYAGLALKDLLKELIVIAAGFELSKSRSRNGIYFSIIVMPNKSHYTFFAVENLVQNTAKTWIPFILFGSSW